LVERAAGPVAVERAVVAVPAAAVAAAVAVAVAPTMRNATA
jgi:hypothetical protein